MIPTRAVRFWIFCCKDAARESALIEEDISSQKGDFITQDRANCYRADSNLQHFHDQDTGLRRVEIISCLKGHSRFGIAVESINLGLIFFFYETGVELLACGQFSR